MKKNFSLKSFNTFNLDVKADYFFEFSNENEIIEVLKNEKFRNLKHLILGGGSNILFLENFKGLVLYNQIKGIEILERNNENIILKVGAGENFDDFIAYCVENNFYGLENLSGIYGSVGATVIQNVGAYGVEIKDFIKKVIVIEKENLLKKTINKQELNFSYRESIFKNEKKDKFIITYIIISLKIKKVFNSNYGNLKKVFEDLSDLNLKNIRRSILKIRNNKLPDPKIFGNVGSFFKNPIISLKKLEFLRNKKIEIPYFKIDENFVKIPSAYLIENCGLKEKRFKNCGIYEKHNLIIINYGNSNGKEILEFAKKIKEKVLKKFDIKLVEEVNIY